VSCSGEGEQGGKKQTQKKKIKKRTEKYAELKDTSFVPFQHIQQTYNDSGRVVTELFLDGTFTMYGTKGIKYNKYGTVSSYTYTEAVYQEKYLATFDKNDSILESVYTVEQNHIPQKKKIEKFENGMIIEKTQYDGEGNLQWTDKYEWTNNYKKLTKRGYDSKGKPDFVSAYTYNVNGEEETFFSLSPEGDTLGSAIHYYNNKNKLTEFKEYKMGVLEIHEKLEYDKNDNLSSKKSFNDKGEIIATYDYSYNENGDLILKTKKNKNGTIVLKMEVEIEYSN
jgi:hypothetical protein